MIGLLVLQPIVLQAFVDSVTLALLHLQQIVDQVNGCKCKFIKKIVKVTYLKTYHLMKFLSMDLADT